MLFALCSVKRFFASRRRGYAAAILVWSVGFGWAQTQSAIVSVDNPSFEAPLLNSGTWTYNLLGWTNTGPANSSSRFIESIAGFRADGNQHLGLEQGAVVWQDLALTYQPNTLYRLRVAVGNRQNFTQTGNASTYSLTEPSGAFSKNGTINASTIRVGTFADAPILEINTSLSNAFVGRPIQVRLAAGGTGRSQFDNVRLEAISNLTVLDYYRMGDDDPGVPPAGGAVFTGTKDSVGTNHLSAIGAPFWSQDVSSTASSRAGSSYSLWFFGGGPYATASLLTTLTDNFGIEAWVKPSSATGNRCIAYNGNTAASGWGLYQVGNTFRGLFGGVTWVGSGPLTLNAWSHVALVRTGGSARLYINGIVAGSATGAAPKVPAGNFAVGTQPQSPGGELWAGYVDEVRLFAVAQGQFTTNDFLINALLRPPTVLSQLGTAVTANQASVSASIHPRSQTTGVGFEWGPTPSYGSRSTLANTISGSTPIACNLTMAGLAPMTTYHFRAFASNSGGSTVGPDNTFTTPPLPPVVMTLPATAMAGSSATLNASVTSSGSPTTAWFEWGLRSGAYSNVTPMGGFNGSELPLSTSLSGLSPGLVYHARVAATNGGGMARGRNVRFGSPAILLNGPAATTNLLASTFTDPGAAAFNVPLALACGDFYSVGLRADGTVAAWGNNQYDHLSIPASATNVTAIGVAGNYSVALRADGSLVAWGTNFGGSLLFPTSASNVITLAAGAFHTLALRADGAIVGVGRNDSGQINIPGGATNVVAIAAGDYHSLALRADGSVIAWGSNGWGQTNVPPGATNVVAITAGSLHSLALRADGTIVGWGDNSKGQISLPASATNVVAVAGGQRHNLALRADGTLVGWGENTFGQLNFPPDATNILTVATRYSHSIALRADGAVMAWGDNSMRQLNLPANLGALPLIISGSVNVNAAGTYLLTYTSTNILGGTTTAARTVVVEAAPVVTQPASLVSGRGAMLNASINPRGVATTYYFQYGTTAAYGSFTATNNLLAGASPVPVSLLIPGLNPGTTYHFRAVSVNGWGTAFGADGSFTTLLAPWVATLPATGVLNGSATLNASVNPGGDNTTAWLEWGSPSNPFGNTTPPKWLNGAATISVTANLTGLVPGAAYTYRVAASNNTGVARGRPVSFGSPAITLNGQATVTNPVHTVYIDAGASVFNGPVAISAHSKRSLAVRADGTVLGWGVTADGALNIPPSATNVVAVGTGEIHGLALRADGTVVGWGDNSAGQLSIPAAATNLVAISVGSWFNLALRADGRMIGWGNNGNFQLNIPNGVTNPIAIAAGAAHSLAVLPDGSVLGWGEKRAGQIAIPASATNVVAVSASSYFNLALRSNGTVVGWGTNDYGQITIPAGATNVMAVSTGSRHSLALRTDGTIVGWGDNSFGQIDIPSAATNVIAIAAGAYHNLALQADGTIIGWGKNDSGEAATIPGSSFTSVAVASSGLVNVDIPGTYPLTYVATNLCGGVGQVTRTIVVVASAPAVTASPAAGARETTAPLGDELVGSDARSPGTPASAALSSTASIPRLKIAPGATEGALQLSFTHAPGAKCSVLTSSEISLPLHEWTILGEAEEVGAGDYSFTAHHATGTSLRFYRILVTAPASF